MLYLNNKLKGNKMDLANMKILSVDDNKTNLLIIESYAKNLNLQIKSF